MPEKVNVFIGYDKRIPVCSSVLAHSISSRSSVPVQFTFIDLRQLEGIFHREMNPLQSTEFSFSRFLTPYLSNYHGWSIFMDNDMVVLDDIARLWNLRDDRYAVMCVKHDHKPTENTKFLGATQTKYEKKNWSSVMLFNNARCTKLTTQYVSSASGLDLHQFKWLGNDDLIGSLPAKWNHLVDYDAYKPVEEVSLLHYTEGGSYYDDYQDCQYADVWLHEKDKMISCLQRKNM
jgi:lipopolysaccharide biosynthesis glycosyltransferase